jgi:hypothetical protein
MYLLPDAGSSRQDRSESVAMRWSKGSMRFRSRFLFLSKQALRDHVKTADIHSIQSKAGIPNYTQSVFLIDWEWECEIENDVKYLHRMWAGSPRCLSCEDGSLVRKGNDFKTIQTWRYLQHSRNQIDIEKGMRVKLQFLQSWNSKLDTIGISTGFRVRMRNRERCEMHT